MPANTTCRCHQCVWRVIAADSQSISYGWKVKQEIGAMEEAKKPSKWVIELIFLPARTNKIECAACAGSEWRECREGQTHLGVPGSRIARLELSVSFSYTCTQTQRDIIERVGHTPVHKARGESFNGQLLALWKWSETAIVHRGQAVNLPSSCTMRIPCAAWLEPLSYHMSKGNEWRIAHHQLVQTSCGAHRAPKADAQAMRLALVWILSSHSHATATWTNPGASLTLFVDWTSVPGKHAGVVVHGEGCDDEIVLGRQIDGLRRLALAQLENWHEDQENGMTQIVRIGRGCYVGFEARVSMAVWQHVSGWAGETWGA